MKKIIESLVTGLVGVFGLPLDQRKVWPDMVCGGCLSFALLFSLGSLVTRDFDSTFVVSSLAAAIFLVFARRKQAVLGAALLFVGLRSLIAVFCEVEWSAIALAVICFGSAAFLLRGSNNKHAIPGDSVRS
jgi:hypothetical protein